MFTIQDEKLNNVLALVNKKEPSTTLDDVDAFLTADWNEGEDHQLWLDDAPAVEISEWILASK